MNTQQNLEKTNVKPDQFVGTRWIGWAKSISGNMSVEFVDMTNCIYTSGIKKFPLKYNVNDNGLFISCVEQSFELKGDVLFANDIPVFAKAA